MYKLLALPGHLNHVLIMNNRLATIYSRRFTFALPADIRALEIAWRYNIQAPMVQAHDACEVPPWRLDSPVKIVAPNSTETPFEISSGRIH